MSKRLKNIIVVVVVMGVLFMGYRFMTRDSAEDALLVSNAKSSEDAVGREIAAMLLKFQSIHLDKAIFSNPLFITLQDFSLEVIPEEIGRSNPFAPIGKNQ